MSESLHLVVEKMVYGGDGLSRAEGEVVLTPFVLPGETVEVTPLPSRQSVKRARLKTIEVPSADRSTPPCGAFAHCGGCHYQHSGYSAQLKFKRDILVEALRRQGKIEMDPASIGIVSGPPYGYRNRVQLHLENGRVGYREMNSHTLVPTSECPVAAPVIAGVLAKLNRLVTDRRWPRFVRSIELFTDDVQLQWNITETDQPVAKHFFEWMAQEFPETIPGALDYAVGDDVFRVNGESFFQVNRFLLRDLVETALDGLEGDTAWDLYAGVGLFSLPLARKFKQVIAVESGRSAASDLQFNAGCADLKVEVSPLSAEEWLRSATTAPDLVVADPPRAGLGKSAVTRLLELRPRTIVVIACDPTTLARDLAALKAAYTISKVTMVDLFPQTFHIETVVRLQLSETLS